MMINGEPEIGDHGNLREARMETTREYKYLGLKFRPWSFEDVKPEKVGRLQQWYGRLWSATRTRKIAMK